MSTFNFDTASLKQRKEYVKGWEDAGGGRHMAKPKKVRSTSIAYLTGYGDAIKNTKAQAG